MFFFSNLKYFLILITTIFFPEYFYRLWNCHLHVAGIFIFNFTLIIIIKKKANKEIILAYSICLVIKVSFTCCWCKSKGTKLISTFQKIRVVRINVIVQLRNKATYIKIYWSYKKSLYWLFIWLKSLQINDLIMFVST